MELDSLSNNDNFERNLPVDNEKIEAMFVDDSFIDSPSDTTSASNTTDDTVYTSSPSPVLTSTTTPAIPIPVTSSAAYTPDFEFNFGPNTEDFGFAQPHAFTRKNMAPGKHSNIPGNRPIAIPVSRANNNNNNNHSSHLNFNNKKVFKIFLFFFFFLLFRFLIFLINLLTNLYLNISFQDINLPVSFL
jgi:hypothetical protein